MNIIRHSVRLLAMVTSLSFYSEVALTIRLLFNENTYYYACVGLRISKLSLRLIACIGPITVRGRCKIMIANFNIVTASRNEKLRIRRQLGPNGKSVFGF